MGPDRMGCLALWTSLASCSPSAGHRAGPDPTSHASPPHYQPRRCEAPSKLVNSFPLVRPSAHSTGRSTASGLTLLLKGPVQRGRLTFLMPALFGWLKPALQGAGSTT